MTTPHYDDGIVRAGVVAAAVSGLPSTLWSLRHGRDPLEATKAAGRLLLPNGRRTVPLLGSAAVAHIVLSLGWSELIVRTLPRGAGRAQTALHGVMMGGAIAALDLGLAHVIRTPRLAGIRDLPVWPQVADHLAFGMIAALTGAS
ncbi:MAG TPA: hypothetical protein VJ831_00905 [Jatrophihabitantaceae bacterium]|nr:hypothetical protein [Jatrophihabitantaceae bacterium]